jgi:type II pantothenate kinase
MATVEQGQKARDNTITTTNTNDVEVDNTNGIDAESAVSDDGGGAALERKLTNNDTSIPKPGDVRINVKGAFIVEDNDEEPGTPGEDFDNEGYQLDRRGIRLPNHKAVVSHIAVDVC